MIFENVTHDHYPDIVKEPNNKKTIWVGSFPFVVVKSNDAWPFRIYYHPDISEDGWCSGFHAWVIKPEHYCEEDGKVLPEYPVDVLFSVWFKWGGCTHWQFKNQFLNDDDREGYIHTDDPASFIEIMKAIMWLANKFGCEIDQ